MPHAHLPVITDTTHSPFARLRPVPIHAVRLQDSFWQPRRRQNVTQLLPEQWEACETTGRIDNFRRAAEVKDVPFRGYFFNDSDVYKWLEAAAWSLADPAPDTRLPPPLEERLHQLIDLIAASQDVDGYLNTYFTFERTFERWTDFDKHELYCAGHLIQAAIAHYRATAEDRLLKVAIRLAGHICDQFENGKPPFPACGHPEVEMALVELYRQTGEPRYLAQAQTFLDRRGHHSLSRNTTFNAVYYQDHIPFRQLARLEGHSVRAVYLNCGAADLLAERGEPALRQTLERLWKHMTAAQMYVTGGLGSRPEIEGFGEDYELPNARAYSETCAAIASAMWNWRMLQITGEARYADLMEWTLINGMLPGLSLTESMYFYVNPLLSSGSHQRQPWYNVACCPPNIARTLALLPGLFYSVSAASIGAASTSTEGIWVHLYAANEATLHLTPDHMTPVHVIQRTQYPWDGNIELEVQGQGEFSLFLRIPGWCAAPQLRVNGEPPVKPVPGSYAEVRRTWQPGDVVRLELPMPAEFLASHPYVINNQGKAALRRGPVLYCLEAADHPGLNLRQVSWDVRQAPVPTRRPELLGGLVTLSAKGHLNPAGDDSLYRPLTATQQEAAEPVELTAIPYYAWANRAPGFMQVWVEESRG